MLVYMSNCIFLARYLIIITVLMYFAIEYCVLFQTFTHKQRYFVFCYGSYLMLSRV